MPRLDAVPSGSPAYSSTLLQMRSASLTEPQRSRILPANVSSLPTASLPSTVRSASKEEPGFSASSDRYETERVNQQGLGQAQRDSPGAASSSMTSQAPRLSDASRSVNSLILPAARKSSRLLSSIRELFSHKKRQDSASMGATSEASFESRPPSSRATSKRLWGVSCLNPETEESRFQQGSGLGPPSEAYTASPGGSYGQLTEGFPHGAPPGSTRRASREAGPRGRSSLEAKGSLRASKEGSRSRIRSFLEQHLSAARGSAVESEHGASSSGSAAPTRFSMDSNWDEIGDERNLSTATGDSASAANAGIRPTAGLHGPLLRNTSYRGAMEPKLEAVKEGEAMGARASHNGALTGMAPPPRAELTSLASAAISTAPSDSQPGGKGARELASRVRGLMDQINAMTDEELLNPHHSTKLVMASRAASSQAASGSLDGIVWTPPMDPVGGLSHSSSLNIGQAQLAEQRQQRYRASYSSLGGMGGGSYSYTEQGIGSRSSGLARISHGPLDSLQQVLAMNDGASLSGGGGGGDRDRNSTQPDSEFNSNDNQFLQDGWRAPGGSVPPAGAANQRSNGSIRRRVPVRTESTSTEALMKRLTRQQPYQNQNQNQGQQFQTATGGLDSSIGHGKQAEVEDGGSMMSSPDLLATMDGSLDYRSSAVSDARQVDFGMPPPSVYDASGGQLYMLDAEGSLVPIAAPSSFPLPSPPQVVMGPDGRWMMVQPRLQQQPPPAAGRRACWGSSSQSAELCLLATGGVMVLINVVVIAFVLMMRALMSDVRSMIAQDPVKDI